MNTDTLVQCDGHTYKFPTVEGAAEARNWISSRNNRVDPVEFATKFHKALPWRAFLGGSASVA